MITAQSLLSSLDRFTYDEVVALKGDDKIAAACATALIECIHLNFKGDLMYVPTSDGSEAIAVYEAIYNDFKHRNHHELAVKYRRSLPTIYSIVKVMQRIEKRRRQTDIFPLPDGNKSRPITLYVIENQFPVHLFSLGFSKQESEVLVKKICSFLCHKFPGISVFISSKITSKRRDENQISLF